MTKTAVYSRVVFTVCNVICYHPSMERMEEDVGTNENTVESSEAVDTLQSSLQKVVEHARSKAVLLFGNRLAPVGYALLAYYFWLNIENCLFQENRSISETVLRFFLMVGSGVGGAFLAGSNAFGVITEKFYRKTREHILEFGAIDPLFFQKTMEGWEDEKYYGYCQLQGIFLAAKELNKVEEFRALKREHCKNIIPNF